MATEHNALKFAVDITRGVKRIFGVDDNEQGVTRISESLGIEADLWSRPEWAFPIGQFNWSVLLSQSATVAENSFIGVKNNTAEFITVIKRFLNDANVTVPQVTWSIIPAASVPAFTGTGTPNPLDGRIPVTGGVTAVPVQTITHHQNGGIAGAFILGRGKNNAGQGIAWLDVGVILMPGQAFVIQDLTQNDNLAGTIEGYTWRANPGELLTS